nr:f-box/kelch-repeat protein [Quercus suber]
MGPGMYKINFNGLKFEEQRASGIRVVMQDETGFVIAALSKKLQALSKKLQDLRGTDEIETLVVEAAVQLTWEMLSSAGVIPLSCLDYNGSNVFVIPTQLVPQLDLYTWHWHVAQYYQPCPGSVCFSLSVFVNGAVHWIASVEDDYIIHVILSFDIRDNTFHEMALPESLDEVNKLNIKVAVHDGSLALLKSALTCCSVWVMKQYCVAEFWTKLYDIDVGVTISQVVGFTKIGEVLVINTVNGELLSYNPSSQQTSYIDIPAQLAPFYLDTYMESLALLNVEDCASARWANELNLSSASKGKRTIC